MSSELAIKMQELAMDSFESQMENIHTAIPCIVVAVRDNGIQQMVDIQPAINQKSEDGTVKERPPVYGVPVSFPVSSTAGFTFPVKVGDTGLAIYSMRNMDNWKGGNGRPNTPSNQGKMDKGDAIFVPGIQPTGSAVNNPSKHTFPHNTSDAVLFQNLGGVESEVRLKADGSIEINTSNQPVIINCSVATVTATEEITLNAPQLNVNATATTWTGNMTFNGNITHSGNYTGTGVQTFNGVVFSTHKHGSSPPPSN